jgi:hypothetical protein
MSELNLDVMRAIAAHDPDRQSDRASDRDRAEFRVWVLRTYGVDAWRDYVIGKVR